MTEIDMIPVQSTTTPFSVFGIVIASLIAVVASEVTQF